MRLHWFCFSYVGQGNAYASTYSGYPDNLVTIPMINANKLSAGVSKDSVLLAVSYMGYATRQEILGE